MSRNRVISAIDLGTDKCVTLIATLEPETNELRVVGVCAVPSRGMRKSVIVDLEQVVAAISESLDGAERMAGFEIKSAYVSVSGAHVRSRNSKGVVAVAAPDQEISKADVERVIEAARAISLPNETEILHVIPRDYKVDSQDGIKDPIGMTGVRLESEAHIITGLSTSLRNLEKCINDLGLHVDGFVFSALACSDVTLTATEKELGVVLVEIGAGSTSLTAFVEGAIEFSGSIPVGARHITQDIALGCRISLEDAEKIKLVLSKEELENFKPRSGESKEDLVKRRKKEDSIDLEKIGVDPDAGSISKRTVLEGIMIPRLKEIFELVGDKLEEANLLPLVPAGLVLCGGGASTARIVEIAKRSLNLPARIGNPKELRGLVNDISTPSYATSIGLLVFGQKNNEGGNYSSKISLRSVLDGFDLKNISKKITEIVKSILP